MVVVESQFNVLVNRLRRSLDNSLTSAVKDISILPNAKFWENKENPDKFSGYRKAYKWLRTGQVCQETRNE